MPPHCDTMDGPIVTAAKQALEKGDVNIILPFAPKSGEKEITSTFNKVLAVRKNGGLAKEIADMHFFETVVRIHRAGEGAPYTGLKPAGLSEGPVIPVAEKAIETESADELINVLSSFVKKEVKERFEKMLKLKKRKEKSVDDAREYAEAMLGIQVYSHKVYLALTADPHAKAECKHGGDVHKH